MRASSPAGLGLSDWLGGFGTAAGRLPQPLKANTANPTKPTRSAGLSAVWQYRKTSAKALEIDMKKICALIISSLCLWQSAGAALDIGERAPDFSAQGAMAGKVFTFSLAESLAKGPVVLYFFPKAFTQGCSMEAHEFAEATDKFQALGATVYGMSGDDVDTLSKFSTQSCQSKFAVISDPSKSVIKSYDAAMSGRPDFANRVSYVIAPNGSVVYHYVSLNPEKHVEKTLNALREWSTLKAGK